jgi:hypothetical protein
MYELGFCGNSGGEFLLGLLLWVVFDEWELLRRVG